MNQHMINIDSDVFAELQRLATPLVDDVSTVLRRVLGLPSPSGEALMESTAMTEEHHERAELRDTVSARAKAAGRQQLADLPSEEATPRPATMKAPRGSRLPQAQYEVPILEALITLGGSAHSSRVIELVGQKLKHQLTPVDYARVKSGETRWENRTRFARLMLKNRGEIASDSPHGIWEITEAGQLRVASQPSRPR